MFDFGQFEPFAQHILFPGDVLFSYCKNSKNSTFEAFINHPIFGMTTAKKQLQTLVANGQTRLALENLCAATAPDRDFHSEAIALSGRFQNYLREKNGGRAEPDWLDTELNRVNAATLDLIERLPDGKLRGVNNWKKHAAIAVAVIALLSILAASSDWSLHDLFQKPSPEKAVSPQPPTSISPINVTTSGGISPVVIAPGGVVTMTFPETAAKTPPKKDSLIKK